jgi:hypothetical protein
MNRAKERATERKKLEDSKSTNDPLYNFFLSMYQMTQKCHQHLNILSELKHLK